MPRAPLPGQVTGLTATAQPDGSILLQWTDPGAIAWYYIEMSDLNAGGQWQRLPLPVTSCCIMNAATLSHGHTYQFRVVAINATGEGPASAVAQATSNYTPPAAPANLRGVSAGDGTIDLTWDPPAPTLYYWVYARDVTAGQTGFTRSVFPVDQPSASLGPLVHGHVYEFKVGAQNPGGEGPASATIQVTSHGGLPGAPSNLSATAGNGQVTLTWTASTTSNVYHWVYLRDATAGQSWQRLSLPVSGCCTMTVSPLTDGHTYQFKVTAANAVGDSAPSNVASARPMPPFPQPPSGLTATAGDGKVTLHWNASPTANVWYWVEMRSNGGAWRRLPLPVTSCCTMTAGSLVNAVTYEFRLRSTNLSGDSGPSNVVSVRPMPPVPQAPTGLAGTHGDRRVTLTWNASATANVWYWVEMRPVGGAWQRLPWPVTSCCTFTGGSLTNGVTYEFRVRAVNISGESAPSNVVSLRPWPPVPQPPTWMAADSPSGSHATVNLSWGASPTPNVMYWVYYRNASRPTYGGATTNAIRATAVCRRLIAAMLSGWLATGPAAHAHADMTTPTKIMIVGSSTSHGSAGDYTWRYRLWKHFEGASVPVDFVGPSNDLYNGSNAYADPNFDRDHASQWGKFVGTFGFFPPGAKDTIAGDVAAHQPDYVILMLGLNDLAWFTSRDPQLVAADMKTTIDQARGARAGVRLVLVAVQPIRQELTDATLAGRIADFNTRLSTLASVESTPQSPIAYVPRAPGYQPDYGQTPHDSYDGTHPNAHGEIRIADAVADVLSTGFGLGPPYELSFNGVPTGPVLPFTLYCVPGDGRATLAWDESPGATGYWLQRRTLPDGQWPPQQYQLTPADQPLDNVLLTNGVTYEYRLQAARWYDKGAFSNVCAVTPHA